MDSITKEIRKLLLAGLGAAAESKERGGKLLEELAEKGEETLQRGKVANEELKRSIQKTIRNEKDPEDVMTFVKKMGTDQVEALKAKIAAWEEEMATVEEKLDEMEEALETEEAEEAEEKGEDAAE